MLYMINASQSVRMVAKVIEPFKLQAENCYFNPFLSDIAVKGCYFASKNLSFLDRNYTG